MSPKNAAIALFVVIVVKGGNGEAKEDMASRVSSVFAKDWVSNFEEPDQATVEEGRKTIDFLLKR